MSEIVDGESGEETRENDEMREDEGSGMGRRIARRNALKAAAGGIALGAAWVAPRVEGLSLVPDYAAAGTGTASVNFAIQATSQENLNWDNNNSNGTAGYYDDVDSDRNNQPPKYNNAPLDGCDNGGNDWYVAVAASNPGVTGGPISAPPGQGGLGRPSGASPFRLSAPLGNAGNVALVVPQGADGDLDGTTTINVIFDIDPPWNRCRISGVTLNKCIPGSGAGTWNTVNNPGPNVTNPAGFTAQVIIGPQPRNLSQLDITVGCT